jgi:hypothetical protein
MPVIKNIPCFSKHKERISVTLQKKMEIIIEIERGSSQTAISTRESIPISTISSWWKKKEKILHDFLTFPKEFKKQGS